MPQKDENAREFRPETKVVRSHPHDPQTGAVSTPIYQTATFKLAAPGDESGYVYTRSANPTRGALESALAELEGGKVGLTFASGLAATNTVFNLLKAGDHVVAGDDLYGGSVRQFDQVHSPNTNIKITYVDARDPRNVENAITDKTKLVWIETPTNPLLKLYDIAPIADVTRKNEALLAVDNTFATPYLQRPLDFGADLVIHSLTKYMAGHSDTLGGALITKDEKLGERLRFYQNAVGAVLAPFDSWLILRGIKTLAVRLDRQAENALAVARYLEKHAEIKEVFYPGLDGVPLPNKMKTGGGMVSFKVDYDFDSVKTLVMSTKLFTLAESLGGVESLINHPASMTHAAIPRETRLKYGIDDGLVRLSIGIENSADLIDDLGFALKALSGSRKKQTVTSQRSCPGESQS